MHRFSRLALLDSCIDKYTVPTIAASFLPDDTERLFRFGRQSRARAGVARSMEDMRKHLQENAERLRSWQENVQAIERAAERRRADLRRNVGIGNPEPLRDLGLIRWGVALSKESADRLRVHIQGLLGLTTESPAYECATLAAALADGDDTDDDLLVVCSVLWFLEEWELLVEFMEAEGERHALPTELEVMRAAATIRSNPQMSVKQKQDDIDDLKEFLEPREEKRYLLGLGYVLFHAWASEQRISAHSRKLSREAHGIVDSWVTDSFLCGQKAMAVFDHGSLPWAFAVNHCSYVGTCANVFRDQTDECVRELIALSSVKSLWHFRFADTHAWQIYKRADRLWDEAVKSKDRSQLPSKRRQVCELLTRARDEYGLLFETLSVFGDSEPEGHLREVGLLQDLIGCAELEALSRAEHSGVTRTSDFL